MKWHLTILAAMIMAIACFGMKDPSDSIFDDSKINHFELTFYTNNWADSLTAHKQQDEEYIAAHCVWRSGSGSDSVALDSVGVRYKGNSTYSDAGTSPKKPYKVFFNKYKKTQKFFNVEKLNFGNLVNDPSMMREKITYDLSGKYLPTSRAVYATISVQGTPLGLYLQIEEVDKNFLTRNFRDNESNLYKSADAGATLRYLGQNQKSYKAEYDLKTNENADDWTGLINMLDKLNNTTDPANFAKEAGNVLDLDNCIKYLAFNMVNSNFDSYTGSGRNIYLYDDQYSRTFKLIPWDFNLAMGNFTNGWPVITVDAFNIPNLASRPLAQKILAVDSLKREYGRYIKQMMALHMSADSIAAMADRIKPVIDSAVKNAPNNFFGYDTFHLNIENDFIWEQGGATTVIPGIKSFPKKRADELQKQLDRENMPVLDPAYWAKAHGAVLSCVPGASGKSVAVRYSLRDGDNALIAIYSVRGDLLRSIRGTHGIAGFYTTIIDTRNYPSGFYTITLKAGKASAFAKVLLLK